MIFELAGLHARLQETTSAAFGARANRPAYSVLDNTNLRSLGLDDLREWRDALKDYLALQAIVWLPFSFLPFVRGGREG